MTRFVLLLALLLTACAPTDRRTTITLQRFFGACDAVYGGSIDVAKAEGECGIITTLINRFEAENPSIHVRTNIVFWPGYDQLTAQLAANDAPDLVTMHTSVIPDYYARGLLQAIGPDLARAGVRLDQMTPAARRAVTQGGRIYGLPFDSWAPLWHINLAYFRAAGLMRGGEPILPTSAAELLQQAAHFKARTGKPYFVQVSSNEYAAYTRNLYTLLLEQGAPFFANPRHVVLQTDAARRILQLFKDLHDRGLTTVNQDYSAATSSFLNGGGGVMINGTWMVGTFEAESRKPGTALASGYAVRPFPQLFGDTETRYVDGHNWVMPASRRLSKAQADAAFRLLRFLADHDLDWARTGHLPAYSDVIAGPSFRALPHRGDYAVLTRVGQPLPAGVRRQYPIETIIGEESQAAINGNKSINNALADAEHRINELLENS